MLGIIIQARLGSTRLPNKMVLPFFDNKGILEIILSRISSEIKDLPIIVATTTNSIDDKIEQICINNNINYYRGSEDNVLERFILSAKKFKLTKIIRICADNPFLDMNELKSLIKDFKNKEVDYMSFKTKDGTPTILTHYGFWAEAISLKALEKVMSITKDPLYLEHVTNYIHSNSTSFKLILKEIPMEIEKVKDLRLTLDTKQDFYILKEIYKKCIYDNITTAVDIVKFTKENKDWLLQMKEQIKLNTK